MCVRGVGGDSMLLGPLSVSVSEHAGPCAFVYTVMFHLFLFSDVYWPRALLWDLERHQSGCHPSL